MSTPVASSGTSRGTGLVGAYAFDKGSASLAADASGNGNTGAIIGANWTSRGRFGGALRFDGDDDKVRIPVAGSLLDAALTPSGTLFGPTLVAAWFALTSSHRAEAVSMSVIAVVFTAVTLVSLAGERGLDLARDDGGMARSVALGVLFVVAGLVSAAAEAILSARRTTAHPPSPNAAMTSANRVTDPAPSASDSPTMAV